MRRHWSRAVGEVATSFGNQRVGTVRVRPSASDTTSSESVTRTDCAVGSAGWSGGGEVVMPSLQETEPTRRTGASQNLAVIERD
jgi:hypothetical protein